MPVQATCSQCNKRIQAPDKFAGRSVNCPNCQTSVTFPDLAANEGKRPIPSTRPLSSRLVACTECGAEHRLLRAAAQQVRCRNCRTVFSASEGKLYPFGAVPPTTQPRTTEPAAPTPVAEPSSTITPPVSAEAPAGPSPAPVADIGSVQPDPSQTTAGDSQISPTPVPVADTTSRDSADSSRSPTSLTSLTQASVVAPVESAPVAQVTHPVNAPDSPPAPVNVQVDNVVPVATDSPAVPVESDSVVPIQVGPSTESAGGIPIEINTGGGGPPVIATGEGAAGGPYQPVLRQLGPKKSMVGRAVEKDLKTRGSRLKSSVRCKIGPDKSFRERIHQLGIFPEAVEMQVDDMMVLTIGDRAGDFRLIMPFDKGVACPVEFISVMPGRLPTSLGLLRGRGGNWGLAVSNTKPGSLLPQQVQSLMSAVGGQAEAVWAVLDPNEPQTAAEMLQQNRSLQTDLRFDSKVKLGPMEVTYNINWIAQAMPLGPEQYLLVAKFIPRNRVMSMNFGAEWFVDWRDQFHRAVQQLPLGQGNFCCFDYGFIWGAVAQEMMGLKLL